MRLASDFFWAVATVWGEARGEPDAGKVAVSEVIRNRAKLRGWSIAKVVLQPLAFSTWNDHDPNRILACVIDDTDPVVRACANAWLTSIGTNLVEGALNYWNPQLASPSWAAQITTPIVVGNHYFGSAP